MSDLPPLLTLDELVDDKLKVSREWWFRHRRVLIERLGFPAPVAGIPGHWDPRAVRAWLDAQLPAYAKASADAPADGVANDRTDHEAVLLARLQGA